MIKSCKKPPVYFPTVTGDICSFNSQYAGLPLKSCTSLISGYQEGSGTPSPDNVRPLHAFSSANIGQTSGYVEYFRGLLKGTYGFVDLGSLQYFLTPSGLFQTNSLVGIIKNASSSSIPGNVLAQGYTTIDSQSITGPQGAIPSPNMVMAVNKDGVLYFNNTSYTDATAFKTAMSGVYLIYERNTPTTPTITPEQFATLCQAFGITGNTYTFTFGQSIYHGYIDWKRGVAVADYKIADLGSLTWSYRTNLIDAPCFISSAISDIKSGSLPIACSCLEIKSPNRNAINGNYQVSISNNTTANDFVIRYDEYTDGTAVKTALTGQKLAYELATPIEIPLGGIQLLTNQGVNNIFADCGNTTLEYLKAGR